jgi:hypothetical protein
MALLAHFKRAQTNFLGNSAVEFICLASDRRLTQRETKTLGMSSDESKQGVEGANAHLMPKTDLEIAHIVKSGVPSAVLPVTHFNFVHPFKVAARVRIPLGVLHNSW